MRSAPTRSDSSFHCIKSEYAGRSVAKGLANGALTSCDADLIREFVAECQCCNNISVPRIAWPTSTHPLPPRCGAAGSQGPSSGDAAAV